MPLPLIPVVIAGAAAAATGVKKGWDAKKKLDESKELTAEATELYEKARESVDESREIVRSKLEALGRVKLRIYENTLTPFVNTFEKIKNVNFNDPDFQVDKDLIASDQEFAELKQVVLKMADAGTTLAGGAAGGALVAFGAAKGVMLLGAASTGTAISGLSGVAATNATLAWLGGGTLASGGFGVAGGMVVLSAGIAAPAALLGGGFIADKLMKGRLADAKTNLEKAQAAAAAMDAARQAAWVIARNVDEEHRVLEELDELFVDTEKSLELLVAANNDFATYISEQQQLVGINCALAKTVKNIMETPVFDENGEITKEVVAVLHSAKEQLVKLSDM